MKYMYECTYYEMHVQYNVMKCMHDCNYYEMYAWMHDVVQKDEISMRNKDSMNACYVMYYKRFIDA